MHTKVGFIGAGNMAGAIIRGMIKADAFPSCQILVYDLDQEKCASFAKLGVTAAKSAKEMVTECGIVFLAVKPQNFEEVLTEIKPVVTSTKIFVSIAAGISSSYITKTLGCLCPIVRTMPNTPMLIGKGATAMCRTENVSDQDFELIQSFFRSCGIVTVMTEEYMNAVISVHSSSPAYIYLFAKAMIDAAVKQGIERDTALELVCQTLEGSAGMLRDSGSTPEQLIRMVSSPGGTTLKALDVFYEHHLEETVEEAMEACTRRAEELGR